MRTSLVLLAFAFPLVTMSQQIKNTASFISYFTGIKNVIDYKKMKDSTESLGRTIQASTKLTSASKDVLKGDYNIVQKKSEDLYNGLFADLTNRDKRKQIMQNPTDYVSKLNDKFTDIKTANTAFVKRYNSLTGDNKSLFLAWLIQNFLLPVVREFINEIIDNSVKKILDSKLKPFLVIKPWADLATNK